MKYKNIIQTEEEYLTIKKASEISVAILKELKSNLKIGANAKMLDDLALELCNKYKVKPAFLGVPGAKYAFPGNICISTNDEVLHGIPKEERIFEDGDIVKLDFGIIYNGFYTDHCITVGLGDLNPREKALINTSVLCIDTAIKQAVVGNRVGDISYALQSIAELSNLNFITTYCGHGIGKSLWLSPEIPSYGFQKTGPMLEEGMVICIENQITLGTSNLKSDIDSWTLKTTDGSKGAMTEHMVIIRKGKAEVLTNL